MTETSQCRFDRETKTYVQPDGETCDLPRDAHCSARRTCAVHLGWGEKTCARCLGRTRATIRHIAEICALVPTAAMETGNVNSESSMLAGPTTDPEAWSWRKAAARMGGTWHMSLDEDDDETDPERVLTTWAQMLSEDYRLARPERWDVSNAAAFLERVLSRVANDEEQDFPQMSRELKRCRNHLDTQMRLRTFVERGVPCPICVESGLVDPALVRLTREYSHWCDSPTCCREHVTTDKDDIWVCPRDREHWWTHEAYSNRLEERKSA